MELFIDKAMEINEKYSSVIACEIINHHACIASNSQVADGPTTFVSFDREWSRHWRVMWMPECTS